MNFHDIIDIDQPEKTLQRLDQAYFAELIIETLNFNFNQLPVTLDNLDVNLQMNGKQARLNRFNLQIGNSDLSITGFLSDLPAVVHHKDVPIETHLDTHEGKIIIPNMTIESTLGHMEFSGTHDQNNNIDYYLQIPWKTIRKAAWQKLFKSKNDTIVNANQKDEIIEGDPNKKIKYLNLKVKGTIDDYKVSLGKKK